MARLHRAAWVLIVIADAGLLAWGAMAALLPEYLLGPGGLPILAAGYQGFTGRPWRELVAAFPEAPGFMTALFRVYGAYIIAFSVLAIVITMTAFRRHEAWAWWSLLIGNTIALGSAMAYDWTVRTIGPFELTEYLGLAIIYLALIATAPFSTARRSAHALT